MKRVLNLMVNDIQKKVLQNSAYIREYNEKEFCREIYIDGHIYIEYKTDLVFLVNTGDWFNKTIRFDIKMNTYDNNLVLRKGYGNDYIVFERKDFKNVVSYIHDEIDKFYLEDLFKNKKNIIMKNII